MSPLLRCTVPLKVGIFWNTLKHILPRNDLHPMKKLLFVLLAMSFCVPVFAEKWEMSEGRTWARDPNAITMTKDAHVFKIVHTGSNDWALSEGNRISVMPGEVFEVSVDAAIVEGIGSASVSVVTRDTDGQTIAWSYASKPFERSDTPKTIITRFAIPRGVATIEPRIVGYGQTTVHAARFTVQKTDDVRPTFGSNNRLTKENRFLKVEITDDTFSITDKRTGRVWNGTDGWEAFGMEQRESNSFDIYHLERLKRYRISLVLDADAPEFTIRIESEGPMDDNLDFPPPLTSKPGDRLIIPMNEGIGFPVEERDIRARRLIAYGGHGICMAFWGHFEDATGAGMVAIIETADDASIEIIPNKENLLQVGASWEPSKREFRYPRQLRYVFFDKGGHVAACKRYRQHAQETGLLVTFTEKVKRNPNIDKLLGAANIWCWDWDWQGNERDWQNRKIELVKEMQSLGMTRILWSGGGTAEEIAAMNELDGVLTSRYDIYQDIMDPARFDEVAHVHPDWTTEAWPHDINWISPDGTWRKGWEVNQKDLSLPRIPCAVICDSRAIPYARERITKELETKPFTARFLDTTVAAPWFECYHPDHPMTRSDSRRYKMELLKLIGDLGLVCGSETGHDASVPYCDYFEGMLSLGYYRVHESGRNMLQIIDDVPPQIERFQVNPALRLPLWELVYHDCVVAQWYWGDYNNKLPAVWRKRDLFNALYGSPPMYMFTRRNWEANKEKFVESYKTATHVARLTAYAEMTDHSILSPDRMVQQTEFYYDGQRTIVTVNFGEQPFTMPDGATLGGLDWTVRTIPPQNSVVF